MRTMLFVLLIVIGVFASIGCTDNNTGEQENNTSRQETGVSGAGAEELYMNITEEDDYREWSLMPGTGMKDPGQGVHGDMITVYVSDVALSAIENKAGSLPDGSIIVKEGYNSNGELERIVLMQKRDNYAPEDNDWFWAAYNASGEVVDEGRLESCQNCHAQVKDNDYIFTGELN
jgi:hypothetical protein